MSRKQSRASRKWIIRPTTRRSAKVGSVDCSADDGGPAAKAQLNLNRGVNVDGAGVVWIVDSLNQRIRKVDANGIITTVAGRGKACYYSSNNTCGDGGPAAQAGFAVPRAVEFDEAGNLYVADTFNERIRRVDAFAAGVRRATAPGPK